MQVALEAVPITSFKNEPTEVVEKIARQVLPLRPGTHEPMRSIDEQASFGLIPGVYAPLCLEIGVELLPRCVI